MEKSGHLASLISWKRGFESLFRYHYPGREIPTQSVVTTTPLDDWSVYSQLNAHIKRNRSRQATDFTEVIQQYPPRLSTMRNPGGFSVFPCYFNYMDDKQIEIAIDQWIREVDAANIEPDEIAASFSAICAEFDIPEAVGKKFVEKALQD